MERLDPQSSSGKHLRTPTAVSPPPPPSASFHKGKEKVFEEAESATGIMKPEREEKERAVCGICFTAEGERSIRGQIDSCDHYFCFVCIMEWSKVESRCPLCKQRFGYIIRPPVLGLFAEARVVPVPERDQVYHPLGRNETVGPSDPYAETNCSVCKRSVDEQLLLLCDLCDSAAHTYCVDLGNTVPEGDWFCSDCAISRIEHSRMEDDDPSNQTPSEHLNKQCEVGSPCEDLSEEFEPGSPPSISEIVADNHSLSSLSRGPSNFRILAQQAKFDRPKSRKSSFLAIPIHKNSFSSEDKVGARTLQRCRDVHGCIQRLRERWDELRNGSVSFSASFVDSSATGGNRRQLDGRGSKSSISGQSQNQCLTKSQKTSADYSISHKSASDSSSLDVSKAWKMMEAARSKQAKRRGSVSSHQEQKHPIELSIAGELKEKDTQLGAKRKSLEHKFPSVHASGKELGHHLPKLSQSECKSQNNHKRAPETSSTLKLQIPKKSPGVHLSRNSNLSPAKQELKITTDKQVAHQVGGQQNVPFCSGPTTSTLIPNKLKHCGYLEHDLVPPTVLMTADKKDNTSSEPSGDDAKSEIRSLVKLNLKLQQVDKHLGNEGFKKVARFATHTILAACGLEHSKSSARPFPSSMCQHSQEIKQLQQSKLMPNSCRECFYSFVHDVVGSIAAEQTTLLTSRNNLSQS